MIDDINTKRTELANQMAAAGAANLDFTGTAAVLAAIPDTEPQQYVAAGTPENIAAILPATICPQRRMRHGDRPTEALVFDEPAATSGDAQDLQQLKALAMAATPGEWTAHEPSEKFRTTYWSVRCPSKPPGISHELCRLSSLNHGEDADARYIAAANPAVVLGLIARIERAAAPAPSDYRKLTGDLTLKELAAEFDAVAELGGDVTLSAGACRKLFDAMTTPPAAAPAEPSGISGELAATASGDELPTPREARLRLCPTNDERWACIEAEVNEWRARAAVSAATKPDSDLRTAVRDMTVMLANGEWGNPVYSDADTEALSAEIADLVGQASAAATKPTADLSDLPTYDPDSDGFMERRKWNDGDYYKVADVQSLLATKPAPQPIVPEGFVLVPKIPTREMIAKTVDIVFDGAVEDAEVITEVYAAMLSGAPTAAPADQNKE